MVEIKKSAVDAAAKPKGGVQAKGSFDWVLFALILLVGLFAGALFFPKTSIQYIPSNTTCPSCEGVLANASALRVAYLYPMDCPFCNTSRVNSIVSSVGVPFSAYANDAVSYANILVTYQNISTIARATNDYNVLSILCIARNQMACTLKDGMSSSMQSCMQRNNVPLDSVIYYYADYCGTLCNNMNSSLEQIRSEGVNVVRVNEKDDSSVKACLKDFLNYAGGFPQFVCPGKVISYTGAMTEDSLRSFAEKCKEQG